jgi:hypothetical protein
MVDWPLRRAARQPHPRKPRGRADASLFSIPGSSRHARDGGSGATASADSYPVPPDWIIADPDENQRRILAMLEQGDRDIAAGRGRAAEEVCRDAEEIFAAALASQPARP